MGRWKTRGAVFVVIGAGLLGSVAEVSSAALAKLTGGSGYSGALSRNKSIRNQQLVCDPAAASSGANDSGGAPVSGSTSVTYDPTIVSLSGLQFGPGYVGSGLVELKGNLTADASPASPGAAGAAGPSVFLEPISQFMVNPLGMETGYLQVSYSLQSGTPGHILPPEGYTFIDSNGVDGFDTHALSFTYLEGAPDTAAAAYTIYADPGRRPSGNKADSLTGVGPDGKAFTLGPDQLAPAFVSGSLAPATVPLPPAACMGLATLGGLLVSAKLRRLVRA